MSECLHEHEIVQTLQSNGKISSNYIRVKLEQVRWKGRELCGKTELRFRETELLRCSCVSAKKPSQSIQLSKKELLVGSDENCQLLFSCCKTIPLMIPMLLESHHAQMAFKAGVTMCAIICGNKVRQDHRQVYCLIPPVHRLVIPQGLETNPSSIDTEAKTLKK